jgi:hypothetical protein
LPVLLLARLLLLRVMEGIKLLLRSQRGDNLRGLVAVYGHPNLSPLYTQQQRTGGSGTWRKRRGICGMYLSIVGINVRVQLFAKSANQLVHDAFIICGAVFRAFRLALPSEIFTQSATQHHWPYIVGLDKRPSIGRRQRDLNESSKTVQQSVLFTQLAARPTTRHTLPLRPKELALDGDRRKHNCPAVTLGPKRFFSEAEQWRRNPPTAS